MTGSQIKKQIDNLSPQGHLFYQDLLKMHRDNVIPVMKKWAAKFVLSPDEFSDVSILMAESILYSTKNAKVAMEDEENDQLSINKDV